MKIEAWAIGKCAHSYLNTGIEQYCAKLKHYTSFGYTEYAEPKSMRTADKVQSIKLQSDFILSKLVPTDHLIILDDKGREFNSIGFSGYINKILINSNKRTVFLLGGAFGFDAAIYSRANEKISLSRLTFSHDMVRLILVEQLYRGFTILRNEPYHHE
jgi:23S rRNA (pseudouridine1915-N3)-methyltransferase